MSSSDNADLPEKPLVARDAAPTFYVSGFWRRVVAGAVDAAILLPIALLLCKIAGSLADLQFPASRIHGIDFWLNLGLKEDSALLAAAGLTLAIVSTYMLVFQISLGRTLGMRLLRLRVIDVYGDAPSTKQAIGRTAAYLLCVASLGLGFLWIAFDREKRGLHDWLAQTYVVKT